MFAAPDRFDSTTAVRLGHSKLVGIIAEASNSSRHALQLHSELRCKFNGPSLRKLENKLSADRGCATIGGN